MLGEGGRGAQLPLAGLPLLSNRQRPAQSSLRLAFPAQRQEDLALQTIQFSFKKPLSGMRGKPEHATSLVETRSSRKRHLHSSAASCSCRASRTSANSTNSANHSIGTDTPKRSKCRT